MIALIPTYLAILSIAIVIIIGLSKMNSLPIEMKILLVFFIFEFLLEIIAVVMQLQHLNNMIILHIYTPLEYCAFAIIFSFWQKDPRLKFILIMSIFLFLIFILIAKYYWENINRFDNISTTVESGMLVLVSSFTLFQITKNNKLDLINDQRFWISIGVLIYFTSSIVFFASYNIIVGWSILKINFVFIIHSLIDIVTNVLYIKGFLCKKEIDYL